MGLKISEKQLKEMLKNNSKLKISETIGGEKSISEAIICTNKDNKIKIKEDNNTIKEKLTKICLINDDFNTEEEIEKSKAKGVKTSDINKLNRNAKRLYTASDEHVSLLFEGAKLLSVNQIFAILQYRKYEIFTYKKVWHEIVKKSLEELFLQLKTEGKKLPFFNEAVEITLFRQASRLVDEDAMSTMFKYIIDGLKRDLEKNPLGILAEDNPKIVHRIVCYSEKGEPAIGIKIKKIEEKKKKFIAKDILDI